MMRIAQRLHVVLLCSVLFIAGSIFTISGVRADAVTVDELAKQQPAEQIRFFSEISCKQYGCDPKIGAVVATAVFYQECGGKANCTGHAASYKGSFALSNDQFNSGLNYFKRIARASDPTLYALISELERGMRTRGLDPRLNHTLSTAAWFGNNARYIKGIQAVTSNATEQGAIGMMLQLMPTQTRRALGSSNPRSLLTMRLSCSSRGALWALRVNAINLPCGATGAHALNAIASKYPNLRRGVGVALGTAAPVVSNLTSGLANYQQTLAQQMVRNTGLANTPIGKFLGVSPTKTPQIQQEVAKAGAASRSGKSTGSVSLPIILNDGGSSSASSTSLLGFDNETSSVLTTETLTASGSDSQTAAVAQSTSINNTTPTLMCAPGAVEAGEPVMIMWACRDQAYKAVGEGFDTGNETIGKVRVQPTTNTTYSVTCVNTVADVADTGARCAINVAQPAVAFELDSSRTSVSWKTRDIANCTLTSDKHPTFRREARDARNVQLPTINTSTTMTLTCETVTGAVKKETIVVQ